MKNISRQPFRWFDVIPTIFTYFVGLVVVGLSHFLCFEIPCLLYIDIDWWNWVKNVTRRPLNQRAGKPFRAEGAIVSVKMGTVTATTRHQSNQLLKNYCELQAFMVRYPTAFVPPSASCDSPHQHWVVHMYHCWCQKDNISIQGCPHIAELSCVFRTLKYRSQL